MSAAPNTSSNKSSDKGGISTPNPKSNISDLRGNPVISTIPNSFYGKDRFGQYYIRDARGLIKDNRGQNWREANPYERSRAKKLEFNSTVRSPVPQPLPAVGAISEPSRVSSNNGQVGITRPASVVPGPGSTKDEWLEAVKNRLAKPLPPRGNIVSKSQESSLDDGEDPQKQGLPEKEYSDPVLPGERDAIAETEEGKVDTSRTSTEHIMEYGKDGKLTGGDKIRAQTSKASASKSDQKNSSPSNPSQPSQPSQTTKSKTQILGEKAKMASQKMQANNAFLKDPVGSVRQGLRERFSKVAKNVGKKVEGFVKLGSGLLKIAAQFISSIIGLIINIILMIVPFLPAIVAVLGFIVSIVVVIGFITDLFSGSSSSTPSSGGSSYTPINPGSLACDYNSMQFVALPPPQDSSSSLSPGVVTIQSNLSSSWGAGVLAQAIAKYSAGSGKSLSSTMMTIPWLILEGNGGVPDPYLYNCRDRQSPPTKKWDISIPCEPGNYSPINDLVQIGGYQFQDRTAGGRKDFQDVFTACYGADGSVGDVLQKSFDNSANASKEEWKYTNPIYSDFVNTNLFGGSFGGNKFFLEGLGSPASPAAGEFIIKPRKAYDDPTDLQNQALTFLLGKDPCMVAGLNTYAVSANMTAVQVCDPDPTKRDWFACSPYYSSRRQLLSDATLATANWACVS